jgi:hypothetical protein
MGVSAAVLGTRPGNDHSAPSTSYQITPTRDTQPLPPERRLYGLGNLGAVFVFGGVLFGVDRFEPLRECPLPYIRAYGFPQGIQFAYLALGKIGLDNSRFRNHWLSPDAVVLKLGTIGPVGTTWPHSWTKV